MDMKMNSKDSTTAAGASAHQHHHQQQQEAIGAAVVEGRNVRQASQQAAARGGGERKPRPQPDEALRCPRCDSFNTKFCYYNNNSTLQPRHFCKACRRYWTQGGSLRNVPVGGGCRKNKRGGSASSSSSSIDKQLQQQHLVPAASSTAEPQHFPNVLPTFMSTGFDLPSSSHLLPFPPLSSLSSLAPAPPLPSIAETTTPSFLDMLKQGLLDHQGDGFYGPMMSSVMEPPPFGFGGVMQHGVVGDHGGGVAPFGGEGATAAATHQGQGGQWPTTQHVGANQQEEGASVPDTPRAK